MVAFFLLALTASQEDARSNQQPAPVAERPYHEISADLQAFMKREALAQGESEHAACIVDLCVLYDELKRDRRVVESKTLQRYKNVIWSRLNKLKRRLEAEIKKEERAASPRSGRVASGDRTVERIPDDIPLVTANHMALMGQLVGGPMRVMGQRGAGGGAFRDHGPELVALIESTIAPSFWDTNGGPGSIYYYRPLHALVIRATAENHAKIGGALSTLRRVDGF